MVDALKNFAYSLVATAPSPATSGTSLVVTAGQGALFPTAPFDATIWPAGAQPITTNAEIVRVTAVSTDTLTIVRAQYGTTARTVLVGDQIAQTIDANLLSQIAGAGANGETSSFTAAAGGQYVLTGSTASQTATLPSSTAVTGSPISIVNLSSVSWTVAAGSGTTLNVNGVTGSMTLTANTYVTFVLVGTVWYAVNNSTAGSYYGTLLSLTQYGPTTDPAYTLNTSAMTAIDTTNLTTSSFVIPASGRIKVTIAGTIYTATGGGGNSFFALLNHSGGAQVGDTFAGPYEVTGSYNYPFQRTLYISGLTPGNSLQLDLAGYCSTGAGATTLHALVTATPAKNDYGPILIEVLAA